MLLIAGRLLLRFTSLYRPSAYEDLGFHDLYGNGEYGGTLTSQFLMDIVLSLAMVLLIHELVHGLLYRRLTGKNPVYRIRGIFVSVNAPPEFYFPRNQYLVIGMGPLLVFTTLGLMLIATAPRGLVQILILFTMFNAAGSAGDLYMVAHILSHPPETYFRDMGAATLIYKAR
jgi:hypothetical protein